MLKQKHRLPLVALAMLSLLAAMWAGLLRMGWSLPLLRPTLPVAHGPLMVSGFLGTLIGVERAVALSLSYKTRWLYVAPLLSGLGGMVLVAGLPGAAGPALLTLGSVGLTIMFAVIVYRQPALFTAVMLLGALTWLAGNGLWLAGRPIYQVVWWWAGFLILTIAGERLELSRLTRLSPPQQTIFGAVIILFPVGLLTTTFNYGMGVRLTGISMVLLALWLLRYDIARRTVRQTGLPRFTALCLLSGYVWLAIGGILAGVMGGVTAGVQYDAVLHAIFLGFVMAMIFGHAPIIFPSVLGYPIAFRPVFYTHLILLHLSLLLREVGDLANWHTGRRWGGLLNVAVLLLFLANTAYSARQSKELPSTANSQ